MTDRLWVPPPRGGRRKPRGGRRAPKKVARRRGRGCARRAAALVVVVMLLTICLLALVVLTLALPQEGGRINLLLLGIDRRSGTGWAYRTDSIVVVTLDPETRTAGMLSIPRDLVVAMPGHGEDRINTANVYGYRQDNPEGGPDLLKAVMEASFGIPIDGYLMIDFGTFEGIVDTLGGIDVEVPRTLHDTRYPDPRPGDPHAFKTIHFEPGRQRMDGERALAYARSRMSTTDFDRAKRQQLVVLAIRERALSLSAIPRWPLVAKTVADGIKTDMDLVDLLVPVFLAVQIDPSRVQQVILEPPLVYGHRREDGAAVQLPRWLLVSPVIEGLFGPRETR